MRLLTKTHATTQRDCREIEDINGSEYAVLVQNAKNVVEQAFNGLIGITAGLVTWGEGDADFHLSRVLLPAMQTAIADHRARGHVDDGELEPRTGNIWLGGGLFRDRPGRVVRAE